MTEQLFFKNYNQLPENLKQELIDFLEFLVGKHQNKQAGKKDKAVPKQNKAEAPPGVGKQLPIVKFKRSGRPVPLAFGGGKHLVKYMADDFTAPLEDLDDYM